MIFNDSTQVMRRCSFVRLLCVLLGTAPFAFGQIPGLPEPGLVYYGEVKTVSGGFPVTSGTLTFTNWVTATPAARSIVTSSSVTVNGKWFYVIRVPFETRRVGAADPTILVATPNVFELTSGQTAYTRSGIYSGSGAPKAIQFVNGEHAAFSFGGISRGRMDRVDVLVDIPPPAAVDSDGDGVSDFDESIAGTDPLDPRSVFKVDTNIQLEPEGGITISWQAVSGKMYRVSRSLDLNAPAKGFVVLQPDVAATASVATLTDAGALGFGPYFYRIQVLP